MADKWIELTKEVLEVEKKLLQAYTVHTRIISDRLQWADAVRGETIQTYPNINTTDKLYPHKRSKERVWLEMITWSWHCSDPWGGKRGWTRLKRSGERMYLKALLALWSLAGLVLGLGPPPGVDSNEFRFPSPRIVILGATGVRTLLNYLWWLLNWAFIPLDLLRLGWQE